MSRMPGFGDSDTWGPVVDPRDPRWVDPPEPEPPTQREIDERIERIIDRIDENELAELVAYDEAAGAASVRLIKAAAISSDIDRIVACRAFQRAVRKMPAIREMAVRELAGERGDD